MFQRPAQARPCAAHRASTPPPAGAQGLRLPAAQREPLLARTLLVINTPYTYGGNTPEGGFDCSGLIQYAVRGITSKPLPRTTAQWAQASSPVRGRGLARGDFVFFNTLGGRYSHMGIFVGDGRCVSTHASGGTVQRVRMDNPSFPSALPRPAAFLPECALWPQARRYADAACSAWAQT